MTPNTQLTTDMALKVTRILELVKTNPLAAATELEQMADRLKKAANVIRDRCDGIPTSIGGMTDRVQMRVIGPDEFGNIVEKQFVDTGSV